MMIRDIPHEFCVVVEYPDRSFCMATFMHEEDAREYLGTKEDKEYVKWKLYKRLGSSYGEARLEPLV